MYVQDYSLQVVDCFAISTLKEVSTGSKGIIKCVQELQVPCSFGAMLQVHTKWHVLGCRLLVIACITIVSQKVKFPIVERSFDM